MRNRNTLILFAGVFALFVYALMQLFILRYEIGDVYPQYSSFRSDPIGVKAFYGALESLPGVSVQRNLAPVTELPEGDSKTLIVCAANVSKDPIKIVEKLESFAAEGGRILITFYPLAREPVSWLDSLDEPEKKEEEKEGAQEEQQEQQEEKAEEQAAEKDVSEEEAPKEKCAKDSECDDSCEGGCGVKLVSIEERWGFSFAYWLLPTPEEDIYPRVWAEKLKPASGLPRQLPWHSALSFEDMDESWHPLYAWDDHVVVMERKWEQGSIALLSDSYLMSNEAMREERHPELLAWMVGPSSTVIFDEAHLGVRDNPGIMSLIRQYRLDRVLGVMLFLAALFVWRNALSLVPKREADELDPSAAGRDAAAGLINLLRRSIPSSRILSVCVEEWQRSHAFGLRGSDGRADAVRAVSEREAKLPAGQRNLVEAYRRISEIVTERGWKREHSN